MHNRFLFNVRFFFAAAHGSPPFNGRVVQVVLQRRHPLPYVQFSPVNQLWGGGGGGSNNKYSGANTNCGKALSCDHSDKCLRVAITHKTTLTAQIAVMYLQANKQHVELRQCLFACFFCCTRGEPGSQSDIG